jgi:hypothetical protein
MSPVSTAALMELSETSGALAVEELEVLEEALAVTAVLLLLFLLVLPLLLAGEVVMSAASISTNILSKSSSD